MLLLADLYYQRLALCGCKGPLSEEALMELFPKLQTNISTGVSKVIYCIVCSACNHLVPHHRRCCRFSDGAVIAKHWPQTNHSKTA